jgi:hypothetical protein
MTKMTPMTKPMAEPISACWTGWPDRILPSVIKYTATVIENVHPSILMIVLIPTVFRRTNSLEHDVTNAFIPDYLHPLMAAIWQGCSQANES